MECEMDAIEANSGKTSVLVIGDVMVDEYHYCKLERKTPEGPFLVWNLKKVGKRLGGAGNLAHNIKALGAKVLLAGVAQDGEIEDIASANEIPVVLERDGRPTTIKRRFIDIDSGAMLAREDIEVTDPVQRGTATFMTKRLKEEFDVVIYSGYGKGMFNADTISEFLKVKAKKRIADVKPSEARLFRGKVDVIKMNFSEFQELAKEYGEKVRNENADIEAVGKKVRQDLKSDLLVTRSEKGMSYIGEEVFHSRVEPREVIDITGAGDTVTAAFAVSLACGSDVRSALHIANVAASIKLTKKGAVPVSLEDIGKTLLREEKKIVNDKELAAIAGRLRASGKKIVFTNGCFDILHHGHLHFLKKAREFGDVLVVALNSDSSVKKLKGAGRPKIPQHGRSEMLAAFPFVDYVVVFDTDTPEYLVEMVRPNVYVKGKDYSISELPEARIVKSYGGRVELVDLVSEGGKKVSSSELIS